MEAVNAWVAATGAGTARAAAKVDGSSARLAVADNDELADPVFFGPESPDEFDTVRFTVTGLDPDTAYFWAVEVDSTLPSEPDGSFRTHPPLGQPADFTMWASTCAGQTGTGVGDVLAPGRISNGEVFDTIRQLQSGALFGWHGGDIHYYDLGSGFHGITADVTTEHFVRGYDDVLLQPRQHDLIRSMSVLHSWDDHDYGPNDSDRTAPGREAAQEAYRMKVPHPPLPDQDGGIYWSMQVGRVLFIASDVRSYRDPNTTPHGPEKTMLGTTQRQWMHQVLSTTEAQFLVWLCPERGWHVPQVGSGSSADHWGNFPDERGQLVQMFGDLGWLGRMVYIGGDAHHLGMDSGGSNNFGGFPVYQWASLDSTPSSPNVSLWDRGSVGGERGIYGILRLNDTGSQVEVTATGWVMGSPAVTHEFAVQVDDVEPEPPPAPPDPGPGLTLPVGTVSPVVTWLACRLFDGRVIAEIPEVDGLAPRVLGAYTSTQLRVAIPRADPGRTPLVAALQATDPRWRVMVVAVVNNLPTWGGIVTRRLGGTQATLDLAMVSVEGYFNHRYVTDHVFTQVDEATIMAELIRDAGPILGIGPGIGLIIDAPETGILRDREYLDHDNALVYERLTELMNVQEGPEWTVDLDWTDNTRTAIAKIARIRKRIGLSGNPEAVFQATLSSQGEADARYTLDEDCSGDRYANVVLAFSSGEGEDQPRSDLMVDTDGLSSGFIPIIEKRFQPSSGISRIETLNEHAESELEKVRNGINMIQVEARWDAWPRYGIDWKIGDDVRLDLIGHRHPQGLKAVARVVGFDLDMTLKVIRPVIDEETVRLS